MVPRWGWGKMRLLKVRGRWLLNLSQSWKVVGLVLKVHKGATYVKTHDTVHEHMQACKCKWTHRHTMQ